jgi:anti-anti-sigma factor
VRGETVEDAMQIRMQVVRGSLVVRPSGRLTSATASELLQEIEKELAPAPRDVVLNLQSVDAVDAGALAYLFQIQKRARGTAQRFCVAAAPDAAMRLFECTHVAAKLELADSEDDALRAAATVTVS